EQNPTEQIRRNFITRIRNNYTCMLFIRMLLPAILDICTGISASFAMTLAPPSLLEVLTCSGIIFNPIWGFICMRRIFTVGQYGCVLIALIGAVIASCSSFLSKSAPSENPIIGSLLMLVAQMCSSFQYVIEEKLMLKQHYDPTLALGIEGIIGSVLMIILLIIFQLIPGKSVGSVENTLDSFVQLGNSKLLIGLFCTYTISAFLFLSSGIQVTKRLTSLHRVLLSA
ncbi:MAG: Solute carrier family 35 member, partial [Streblomastix strix]